VDGAKQRVELPALNSTESRDYGTDANGVIFSVSAGLILAARQYSKMIAKWGQNRYANYSWHIVKFRLEGVKRGKFPPRSHCACAVARYPLCRASDAGPATPRFLIQNECANYSWHKGGLAGIKQNANYSWHLGDKKNGREAV